MERSRLFPLSSWQLDPPDEYRWIQIFKSSSVSIWPIWVVINELPPPLWYKCTLEIIILNWLYALFYT